MGAAHGHHDQHNDNHGLGLQDAAHRDSDALFGPHAKGEHIIGDGRHGQIFHQHGGSQNRDPARNRDLNFPVKLIHLPVGLGAHREKTGIDALLDDQARPGGPLPFVFTPPDRQFLSHGEEARGNLSVAETLVRRLYPA